MKRDNKKIIYRAEKEDQYCVDIFQDGSWRVNQIFNGTSKNKLEEFWKYAFEFESSDFNMDICRDVTLGGYFNEEYRDAFLTSCIVTGGNPADESPTGEGPVEPFTGFSVEYFGEGEPWEYGVEENTVY